MASTNLRLPPRGFLPRDPRVAEPYRLSPQTAFRIGILGALALAAFGILFLRLWSLQVLSGDRYLQAAQNNQVRTLPLEAPRGAILDRNGYPLVTNKPGTAVRIWVADLPRKRRFQELQLLSGVLDLPLREILAKVERHKRDPITPITLKENVPEDEVMFILEQRSRFPGVFVDDTSLRDYRQGELAPQLLGHVGEVDEKQLKGRDDGVRAGEKIGQTGVEASFDRYLRGRMGSAQLRVDSLGRPTSDIEQTRPEAPGLTVRLTLDAPLQRAAEQALAYGIEQAIKNENWEANAGAIVALDPRDGAILAMASYPEFNPALYSGARQRKALAPLIEQPAAEAANFPALNRAIEGVYPPGSTFKPVTALAAMQEGLLNPYSVFDCDPVYTVYREDGSGRVAQEFKNWNYPADGGPMTLPTALAASCDTYFYSLGYQFYRLSADRGQPLQFWARRLGFGQTSGFDVGPENEGLLPTIKWRQETFSSEIDRLWKPGDSIQLAIGQKDLLVTPLQMARFYALIANRGKLVTPYLLQQVERGDPQSPVVLRRNVPAAPRNVGVDEGTLSAVRQGLFEATHSSYGTSSGVFGTFPIDVAGKTGTAEKVVEGVPRDQSWWCGYGPAENAELVVCAVIENGGFGAEAAAPAALRVFEKFFHEKATFVREVPSD
jgi:penicillin-binding protein 2